VGFAVFVAIIYYAFWPFFRRICCLQVLPFFSFLDGYRAERNATQIFYRLKEYPSHSNQAAGIMIAFAILPFMVLGFVVFSLIQFGTIAQVAEEICQILFNLLFLWPMTALAGFYRLVLYPKDPD
jgi:hypothetical protein